MSEESKKSVEKVIRDGLVTSGKVHRLPMKVNAALKRVLEYLWDAEFEEYLHSGQHTTDHVLLSLAVIRDFVEAGSVCTDVGFSEHLPVEQRNTYWGRCPQCGKCDGFLNIGKSHWFYCQEHRVKWCAGFNLMAAWRRETEDDWQRNREFLHSFTEVLSDP